MGGVASIFSAIAPVFSSLLAPDPPSYSPAPPAPAAAPPPPPPEESSALDVSGEAPVIDSEAAKVRANKRRKAAEDRRLFSLSDEEDSSVILTKSLLGE